MWVRAPTNYVCTSAIVHHANQFLITEGYENRHGLAATLGSVEEKSGFAWILELHRSLKIPVNLHFSGTLRKPSPGISRSSFPSFRGCIARDCSSW